MVGNFVYFTRNWTKLKYKSANVINNDNCIRYMLFIIHWEEEDLDASFIMAQARFYAT